MNFKDMNQNQKRAYWRLGASVKALRKAISNGCSDIEYDRLLSNVEICQDQLEEVTR